MDPGLVRLTCFSVVYFSFCFLDLCQNGGGSYMYMIRMHAYRCDKSNDISICNLKEFECIQEYKNNSDIFKYFQQFWDSRLKIPRKYFLRILNLESHMF